jgi:hypothetical protein
MHCSEGGKRGGDVDCWAWNVMIFVSYIPDWFDYFVS